MTFAVLTLSLACGGGGGDGSGGGDGGSIDTTPGTGTIEYMETCDLETNDCDSTSFCFEYGEGAVLCTRACESDAQCEAPSVGCNGKGICKRPGGVQ